MNHGATPTASPFFNSLLGTQSLFPNFVPIFCRFGALKSLNASPRKNWLCCRDTARQLLWLLTAEEICAVGWQIIVASLHGSRAHRRTPAAASGANAFRSLRALRGGDNGGSLPVHGFEGKGASCCPASVTCALLDFSIRAPSENNHEMPKLSSKEPIVETQFEVPAQAAILHPRSLGSFRAGRSSGQL